MYVFLILYINLVINILCHGIRLKPPFGMIPTITVFVSTPVTIEENEIVKRFVELGFAPLVDAVHAKSYDWFIKNVKPVPHKLFNFKPDSKKIYYYEVDDLNTQMDFTPHVMIHWNEDVLMLEDLWRSIRKWLIHKFYTYNDLPEKFDATLIQELETADMMMRRPLEDVKSLELPLEENKENVDPGYSFRTHYVEQRDTMLYEVRKPNTDMPYTSVIRNYSSRGHKAFFPTLYICNSWGVSRFDVLFLEHCWNQLGVEGEFDMDQMLKEATEKCYPDYPGGGEPEPVVYRRTIEDVLITLQNLANGVGFDSADQDIPLAIKDRFD
jgi:hypothetical protein